MPLGEQSLLMTISEERHPLMKEHTIFLKDTIVRICIFT